MKIKLIILICGFAGLTKNQTVFSQELLAEIPTDVQPNRSVLYSGLLNEEKTILLVNISDYSEAARKSHYYIINLETYKLMSSFNSNRWTYLGDAYFYNDKYLYITFGIKIRTVYKIYDISSGEKIDKIIAGKSPKGAGYRSNENEITYSKVEKNEEKMILDNCTVSFNNQTGKIQFFSK